MSLLSESLYLRNDQITFRIPILRAKYLWFFFKFSTFKFGIKYLEKFKNSSSVVAFKSNINKNIPKKDMLYDYGTVIEMKNIEHS